MQTLSHCVLAGYIGSVLAVARGPGCLANVLFKYRLGVFDTAAWTLHWGYVQDMAHTCVPPPPILHSTCVFDVDRERATDRAGEREREREREREMCNSIFVPVTRLWTTEREGRGRLGEAPSCSRGECHGRVAEPLGRQQICESVTLLARRMPQAGGRAPGSPANLRVRDIASHSTVS